MIVNSLPWAAVVERRQPGSGVNIGLMSPDSTSLCGRMRMENYFARLPHAKIAKGCSVEPAARLIDAQRRLYIKFFATVATFA
jgi:hypothetical protein